MSNVDVSVIMPNYNGALYIRSAIESVLNQKNVDLELIIIDDNSNDESVAIINSYKDSRIRLFALTENVGPGNARNLGLKNAVGTCIFFLDSDDFIPNFNVFDILYSKFNFEVDAVCGNISSFDTSGVLTNNSRMPIFKDDAIGTFGQEYIYSSGYYRFMFKSSLINKNDIKFPDYMRRQDPVFLVSYLSKFCKIYFSHIDVYRYRVTHKKVQWDRRKIADSIKSFKDNMSLLDGKYFKNSLQAEYENFIYYLCKIYIPWAIKSGNYKILYLVFEIKRDFDKNNHIKKINIFKIFSRTVYLFMRAK